MKATAIQEEPVLIALRKLDPEHWSMTAADLLTSGLVGLWADRTDIDDSLVFAQQLRQMAGQQRMQRH